MRSRPAGRVVLERDLRTAAATRGARVATPTPGAACSGRWSGTWSGSLPMLLRPVVRLAAPPAAPGALRRARRCCPAHGLARHRSSASRRPGRCSPASRRTRCCRCGRPLTASFGARPRAAGARGRLAGRPRRQRARSPRRSRPRRAALGVEIETGRRVDVAGRPAAGARGTCSTSRPARCSRIAGDRLPRPVPAPARQRFRYGPGVFKIDWALDGPDPVDGPRDRARRHRAPRRARWARSSRAEAAVARGPGRRPAVRAARPADARRPVARPGGQARRLGLLPRPQRLGRATRPPAIEAQVERFAPGFRDRILAPRRQGRRGDGGLRRELRRRRHQRRHRRTRGSCSSGRSCAGTRTRRRTRRCSCAPRRRRRAAASTACAARTPPGAPPERLRRSMTAIPVTAAARSRWRLAGSALALVAVGLLLATAIVLTDAGGVLLVLSYGVPGVDPRRPPTRPADRLAAARDGTRPAPRHDSRHGTARSAADGYRGCAGRVHGLGERHRLGVRVRRVHRALVRHSRRDRCRPAAGAPFRSRSLPCSSRSPP